MARQLPKHTAPNQHLRVYFFGGEPTLNLPAIDAVMDELDSLDVDYVPKLITNGIFGDDALQVITERHMVVQFSYDGPGNPLRMKPQQHERLRKNISACAERGLPIIIRPTISSMNAGSMRQLLDDAFTLAGKQLVSINFGMLNPNKGAGQEISSTALPGEEVFAPSFEGMLDRARELGVRISSPHMTAIRSRQEDRFFQHCFLSIHGHMSIAASYGTDHPESRNLIFGQYDQEADEFSIDFDVLRTFSSNYMRNAFLCDQQGCYAQSFCGGIKKAVKFCREVYPHDHLEFFRNDIECASMRRMAEVYLIDLLKVFSSAVPSAVGVAAEGDLWSVDVRPLTRSVY